MLASSYPRYPGDPNGVIVGLLARELVRRGHEVHVVAPWDMALAAHDEGGVQVHRFRYAPRDDWHLAGHGRSLEADVRMKRLVPLLMPGYVLIALGKLLALHRRARFDVLHAHWAIPGGVIGMIAARLTGLPLLITPHGSDIYVAEHSRLWGGAARMALRAAWRVAPVSEDLRRRAVALGLDEARSLAIPPGPEAERFASGDGAAWRARLGVAPEAPVIGALGRLVYKKGFDRLIAAMPAVLRAIPDAYCVIGGAGDLSAELAAQARALGLAERVLFPGHVSSEETPDYYALCDVVAAPSVVDQAGNVDGLPLVVVEAMAAGRALAASRVARIPDVVEDGVTGRRTPPGDEAALAEALIRLLRDPALRQALGGRARQAVVERYSIESMARRYEALYAEAVAARG